MGETKMFVEATVGIKIDVTLYKFARTNYTSDMFRF